MCWRGTTTGDRASFRERTPQSGGRRNRDTVLTVRSDVVEGVQAPDVTAAILPRLDAVKAEVEDAAALRSKMIRAMRRKLERETRS